MIFPPRRKIDNIHSVCLAHLDYADERRRKSGWALNYFHSDSLVFSLCPQMEHTPGRWSLMSWCFDSADVSTQVAGAINSHTSLWAISFSTAEEQPPHPSIHLAPPTNKRRRWEGGHMLKYLRMSQRKYQIDTKYICWVWHLLKKYQKFKIKISSHYLFYFDHKIMNGLFLIGIG